MSDTTYAPLGLPDPEQSPAFYSGVPTKRALAWVVDVIVALALSLLVLPFTAFTGIFFFPALMLFVGFFYRWFTIASGSATWGMRLMAIELRDAAGQRLTSGTAFAHTAGYTFSVMVAPLQLVSMAFMVLSPRKQGLSDHLLGTAAINRPVSY